MLPITDRGQLASAYILNTFANKSQPPFSMSGAFWDMAHMLKLTPSLSRLSGFWFDS